MTPRIYIVDDEAPARTRLMTLLSDIAQQLPHQLVGMADHAQAAQDGIAATRPDIVLLDVQMPGMSGIELASYLTRHIAPAPAVIFITAYDEYALKAFEVHALDYLLKPVRAQRLVDAIQRVTRMRGDGANQHDALSSAAATLYPARRHFSVQERDRVLLVPIDQVLYLKAELKYVTVRTVAHEYLIEESLSSLEAELSSIFVRVHRNALVARSAIAGVEKGGHQIDAEHDGEKSQESWQVIVRGIDDRLPISRRQWSLVKGLVR